MTFMEVKGHQRSNVVTYVLRLPYLVIRTTDARNLGQRSTEVKLVNYALWLANLIRRIADKLKMLMTFMGVKGYHRSNIEQTLWLPKLVKTKQLMQV